MDKSAIKSFAIEARKILMKSAITQAGFYGVSKDGCVQPTQKGAGFEVYRTIAGTDNRIFGDDIKRREKLVRAVEEKGFDQVIEETAYTWFNRLIAIRFMEVNGYLPTRTRVLSSETGSNAPDLMSQYMDVDLDMTMDELEKVQTCVRENRYDDAFALLFVKQCNALNDILPELFEKTTDYMELLLKLSYTSDGVVRMLVDTIPESNFDIEQEGQIEIIGWMYQYYNTELKDDTFALLKKNVKITKERIPSATQLFTPDWIVRYMVENSLGRLWVEGHPDEDLKANWKYYLEEAEQEADVQAQLEEIRKEYKNLNPEDIKVIDPCMGSGHILVYCFDVLMQIYESQGYTQRDAARLILENNLYGLDIDKRATQLAYFAVMMKARQYDRRIFARGVSPHVYAIEESNMINREQLKYFGLKLNVDEKNKAMRQMKELLNTMSDAKEYGSLLNVTNYDWKLLSRFVECIDNEGQMTFDTVGIDSTQTQLIILIEIAKTLAQKYHVVVTNPPYMSSSNMGNLLLKYTKKNYTEGKNDLFAAFMQKCLNSLTNKNGFTAMITMHSWMFLSRYQALRLNILNYCIENVLHLGSRAFEDIGGEVVQTVSYIIRKSGLSNFVGRFEKVTDYPDAQLKQLNFNNLNCTYYCKQRNYANMVDNIIAYWISDKMGRHFEETPLLGEAADCRQGIATGNNDMFLRFWHEVKFEKINFVAKSQNDMCDSQKLYAPYNKGGTFRRWYGNREYVIKIDNANYNLLLSMGNHLPSRQYYYRKGITWNDLSTVLYCARYVDEGFVFDAAGPTCFYDGNEKYLIGLLNSKVAQSFLNVICQGLHYSTGHIPNIPFIKQNEDIVNELVEVCLKISKQDWNSFETSWDFSVHPLVLAAAVPDMNGGHKSSLVQSYGKWEKLCGKRFSELKENEEELNRIFIDIYGLQDELTPEVEDKDVTVRKANLGRDIRSLISYAVGCMFGRYSLDNPGLIYAGGEWQSSKYSTFIPDRDSCIPITDEEYFEDDIVGLFCEWMKTAFDEKSLEENLDFIAKALGNKGTTSREVIRNYFLNDFMKDHMKIYQKRPIYWMFDSGKQNGFKCLIYMHRYDRDTVGRVRSDYLRKSQEAIEAALKNAEYTIQNSTSAIDKATATKKRDKYIKQLSEIRTYFQALSHVALQRIDIDLDDGVKVNYEKFQNIEIVDENGKKQKINLLTKI